MPGRVSDLQSVIAFAAGQYHALAVTSDGLVWGWGFDKFGEVGDGGTNPLLFPTPALNITGATVVAAGIDEHSLAVTGNGTVYGWGYNNSGEVGDGTTWNRLTPVKVTESGFQWKVGTPIFSLVPMVYNTTQSLTLSCATSGSVTIHYTTDGTDPTSNSSIYSSAIPITATTTVKAKASKTGMPDSNIGPAVYTLQVGVPSFSPTPGTYTSAPTVTMSTVSTGATIHYTTDGSTPTTSSATYSAPFVVSNTTTFNAAGFKTGWTTSYVGAATYTMNFGTLATPTVSPSAGPYVGSVTVTLSAQNGATIHYTTDGSTPTTSSPTYTAPVVLTTTTTLNAAAFSPNYTTSSTTTATYTLQAVAPTLSPGGGTYAAGQAITLSSTTPGAQIYYSLDGKDPTQSDPWVSSGGSIFVGTYTLKAKTFATGMTASTTVSANYVVTGAGGGAR